MWAVSIGTMMSAFFILAANSFMQNPVGITVNPERDRAEMNDIWAVLTQPLNLWAYSHVIFAAILTGAVMFAGVGAWFLMHKRDVEVFRPSVRLGLVGMLIGSLGTLITGDLLAKVMTEVQPMKMAAAEALWDGQSNASFSLVTIGSLDGTEEVWSIRVPGVLSFMATGAFDGYVEGINDVQAEYEERYGPGDYRPNIPVTYWMFRIMMGAGFIMIAGLDRRALADPQGPDPGVEVGLAARDDLHRGAVHRQRRGLDLHRDGPPALDGGGPVPDGGVGLAVGVRRRRC